MAKHLILFVFIVHIIFFASIIVRSIDETPIPEAESEIQGWFDANVKQLAYCKGTLNPDLEVAEATPKIIKVRQDGSGEFKTITDAVKSIPAKNTQRVIVDIRPEIYTEKVTIERDKPFISFVGPPEKATLQFGGTANEYGTVYIATLQVELEFFIGSNLIIKDTAPRPDGKTPGAQALALRLGGSMAALHNCKLIGFQDTLCDDKGFHFFKDCYMEGTIDFYSEVEKLQVIPGDDITVIAAQVRGTDEDTRFLFVHCSVTGTSIGAFLGRAWMPAPRAIFAYTSMNAAITLEGWSNNAHPEREPKIIFGEYKNSGPGLALDGLAKFSKQLSDAEVKPYLSLGFIKGSGWLLPPPKL